jgi:hypothetical protein
VADRRVPAGRNATNTCQFPCVVCLRGI